RVGDIKNNVMKNRKLLTETLGIHLNRLITCEQVHGDKVTDIKKRYDNKSVWKTKNEFSLTDGLMTGEKNLFLSIMTADCIPLALISLKRDFIAALHVGRKGLEKGIIKKAMKNTKEKYGIELESVIVFAGPSIGFCCYEVQGDVLEKLKKIAKDYLKKNIEKRYFFDLKSFCRKQLIESGIRKENIWMSELCTSCKEEDFFSFRRDAGKTGRQGLLVGIIE
ncbi:MAG: peptidoglycan editing factor PgeF, partial [Actinomycetia bacterium]|nr:peptidoglycan editing factor PgeF [Actinomycetes bacterium]